MKKQCYTCQAPIECSTAEVRLLDGGAATPRYNAPLICRECRQDKKKFTTARKAMLEFFGWEETKPTAVPLQEL